ncbi:hypothetical protein ACO0RG_002684 [Hanseniaspora osmophila]|uniref:Coatomer subunit beta n=1 Tax=Hanseniaspora osmophila TaxID=56408 RepID=A0A1E5R7I7_9ASCO|nr:Coatomer subunit beta [Hanseniaspora osmophila]
MASISSQPAYNLVYDPYPNTVSYTTSDYQKILEQGTDFEKVEIMKRILVQMLDGNPMPELLMHVIRFVMPSKDKQLKKLLYFYWEIVPKLDADGSLRQEMILVCNAIQRDLQHPNEYIRGNTLRFLTKLKEPDLLEQMVPSVRECLEYRHAYVRKYAILAVLSIFNVSERLFPDAPEVIQSFLIAETDPICTRNAFVALTELDRDAALEYVEQHTETLEQLDPLLQEGFIEFIRKDASKNPVLKVQYIDLLQEILISSSSNEVTLDCCMALSILTNSSTILREVAKKLIDLSAKESDNNVKLVILERIENIHQRHPGSLEELTSDILTILNPTDLDVCSKVLDICLELISSKNASDIVKLLKKELLTTFDATKKTNKALEYRTLLIKSITKIAVRFVEVAVDVVSLLLGSINEFSSTATNDIVVFIKQVVDKYPELRSALLSNLADALLEVKFSRAYRGGLWILGEFSLTETDIQTSWKHIRSSLGPLPLSKHVAPTSSKNDEPETKQAQGPVVLPDGTYATESSIAATAVEHGHHHADSDENVPPLRHFIMKGDYYTAAILSSTILKLVLHALKITENQSIINGMKAEGALMLVSCLRYSEQHEKKIDEDSQERILDSISILMEPEMLENEENLKNLEVAFLDATMDSFQQQLKSTRKKKKSLASKLTKSAKSEEYEVDKQISFRLFTDSAHNGPVDTIEEDLLLATQGPKKQAKSSISKLSKIIQLTGFSDPVYAEACVTNNQFDVVLDVLLVNQTRETLKNLHCQFAALGDLKIMDTPASTNVVPHGFHKISVTCKVTSADTGVIFGNIIYDGGHGQDAKYVIMNDIHVDIMDYIKPGKVDDAKFRTMWNEFEWENKITVKSKISSLQTYLEKLIEFTNMGMLTEPDFEENTRFLSCNLYSKSSFGEEALANLCIEKLPESNEIVGSVRIRAKGQGLALSLGDRIAAIAKQDKKIKLDRI